MIHYNSIATIADQLPSKSQMFGPLTINTILTKNHMGKFLNKEFIMEVCRQAPNRSSLAMTNTFLNISRLY